MVGADTTPKGFLAPAGGYRPEDPDWARFTWVSPTPPTSPCTHRRRMDLYGDTLEDFAAVKVKNSRVGAKIPARATANVLPRKTSPPRRWWPTPLRLMDICATSDGGAALIVCSLDYARRIGKADAPGRRHLHRHAHLRQRGGGNADIATDSAAPLASRP